MNIGKTGLKGECMVADFLSKNGYTVIKRNFSCRFGEIDIISETKEYIVFTEVKTRKENSLVSPAQSVIHSKQRKLRLTAENFLTRFKSEKQPRFDVAEVTVFLKDDGKEGFRLNYIKNAF